MSDFSPTFSRRTFSMNNDTSIVDSKKFSMLTTNAQIGNIVNLKNDRKNAASPLSTYSKSNSATSDILGLGTENAEEAGDILVDLSNFELPNYEPPKCSSN